MNIRPARIKDCPKIAILNQAVQFPHAAAEPRLFKAEPDRQEIIAFFEAMIENMDHRILILEKDGEAVGYLLLEIMRRPENPFMHAFNLVYIHHIAVSEEKQGQGYGTRLLEGAIQLAREEEINRVALDSWSFNTAAHEFFKRNGFETFNLRMSKIIA